ncbi:glycoside hydrolase family 66 protein [Hymenobacter tenuis]
MFLTSAFGVQAQSLRLLTTNKARYVPGEEVRFQAAIVEPREGLTLEVRYYQTHRLVAEQTLSVEAAANWNWTPPAEDFKGYLVGLTLKSGSTTVSTASIGVDVSSDWTRFPRYGFLSQFGVKTSAEMDALMVQLNRYHLNGLQFYDWMDKHHRPLAGTPQAPAPSWNDLANRYTSLATIKGYIDRSHTYGMKSMFYNLVYGAYSNAAADGVSDTWGLYRDINQVTPFAHSLPSSWETSSLRVMDPANTAWQAYLLGEHAKVYEAAGLNFDGWHADQLGDWGTLYNYKGQAVNQPQGFAGILTAAKAAHPGKALVMNAVNQYGQARIAPAPVDFLYTELWTGNEEYVNLGQVIRTNETSAPGKRNVLAAYINKGRSGNPGTFNSASVLMADAVMFAFGGAHIELGEHMLGNEYFPNNNLKMSAALQRDLTTYYDFLVGYENLLRDQNRSFTSLPITGAEVQAWPPVLGKVATLSSTVGSSQVFHLLNFRNARTLNWRDDNQVQPTPTPITDLKLSFPLATTVTRLWAASPDINHGLPQLLPFTQNGPQVAFTLPKLTYWTMVVAETGTITASSQPRMPDFSFASAPNPFTESTSVHFTLPRREETILSLYDLRGHLVASLPQGVLAAGPHQVALSGSGLPAGVYLCRLQTSSGTAVLRVVKLD